MSKKLIVLFSLLVHVGYVHSYEYSIVTTNRIWSDTNNWTSGVGFPDDPTAIATNNTGADLFLSEDITISTYIKTAGGNNDMDQEGFKFTYTGLGMNGLTVSNSYGSIISHKGGMIVFGTNTLSYIKPNSELRAFASITNITFSGDLCFFSDRTNTTLTGGADFRFDDTDNFHGTGDIIASNAIIRFQDEQDDNWSGNLRLDDAAINVEANSGVWKNTIILGIGGGTIGQNSQNDQNTFASTISGVGDLRIHRRNGSNTGKETSLTTSNSYGGATLLIGGEGSGGLGWGLIAAKAPGCLRNDVTIDPYARLQLFTNNVFDVSATVNLESSTNLQNTAVIRFMNANSGQTIASLEIDGWPQRSGTYGAIDSGAKFQSDIFFVGTDAVLTVTGVIPRKIFITGSKVWRTGGKEFLTHPNTIKE